MGCRGKLCSFGPGFLNSFLSHASHCWATPPVRLGLSGRNSGKIPERPRKRSQSVSWNSRREYGWDAPNPIIQGILRLPEHFQNYLPPSTAGGDASFFRSGSGEGLPEPVMEFPAVLGVFLNCEIASLEVISVKKNKGFARLAFASRAFTSPALRICFRLALTSRDSSHYPLTRNYYENNSLRIIFRNF